ncbi:SpoVG family protein [Fibrobacter sp.]|jgi:stage V sporulation protein G|uniref:SpoVG family protein n=1 Tax=Fibrobacter sp. TaxID=35828 RepID=UPI001B2376E5|nr:SpoVG family protein [Fibrobacter sp.]MBO7061566.1 SpoVG family protein [Fibrobacter sp.]MBO7106454.1 SpoVG family protein [Fibrobacter sp.]MBR3669926.1 SpoVG family protein [Fibrobacter sp.]
MSENTAEKTTENIIQNESTSFDCLAVTNVQIFPFKEGMSLGKIKAMASVVLNDQFQIRGLRVVDGTHGYFVGYPSDPFFKGEESRYVCAPITRQLREHIENCVLERYQQCMN